jgi:uncharacterized membrane protein
MTTTSGGSPSDTEATWYRTTPWVLIIGGVVGWLASFELTLDKIRVLADPDYSPSCDINPVVSCGSVIVTEQASVFGFPNPIIGLGGFAIVLTLGVLLAAKTSIPRWVWLGLNVGALGGLALVVWLVTQSLYSIGALCPWCMVVWVVTIAIFWVVTAENASAARFSRGPTPGVVADTVAALRWVIIGASYALILGLIFVRWMDFWLGN